MDVYNNEAPRSPSALLEEYIRQHGPIPSVLLTIEANVRGGGERYLVEHGHIRLADGEIVNKWDNDVAYPSYREARAAYDAAVRAGAVGFLRWGELSPDDCLDVLCHVAPDDLAAEATAWREIAHALWRLSWADGVGPHKGGGNDGGL